MSAPSDRVDTSIVSAGRPPSQGDVAPRLPEPGTGRATQACARRRHNGRLVEPREELSDFLRSRRGRLTPDELGLRSYGPRRVPGLRREELAQLAGVSVDYYTRLEQGRGGHPSHSVLDAIARALKLDQAEASHLRRLAAPQSAPRRKPPPERVRPAIRLLLERLDRGGGVGG